MIPPLCLVLTAAVPARSDRRRGNAPPRPARLGAARRRTRSGRGAGRRWAVAAVGGAGGGDDARTRGARPTCTTTGRGRIRRGGARGDGRAAVRTRRRQRLGRRRRIHAAVPAAPAFPAARDAVQRASTGKLDAVVIDDPHARAADHGTLAPFFPPPPEMVSRLARTELRVARRPAPTPPQTPARPSPTPPTRRVTPPGHR